MGNREWENLKGEVGFLVELVKPYKYFYFLFILGSLIGSAFDSVSIGMLMAFLASLASSHSEVDGPRPLQSIMALLEPYDIETQLYIAVAFAVLAVILKHLFLSLSVKLGYWLTSKIIVDLRVRIMNLLMSVGIDFHRKSSTGDLMMKGDNYSGYVEILIRQGIEFIINGVLFCMLLGLLLLISWELTLLTLLVGFILSRVVSKYSKGLTTLGEQFAETQQEMAGALHENLLGIQLVKSYSREEQQVSLLRKKVEKSQNFFYILRFRKYLIDPITESLGIIGLGCLLVIAVLLNDINISILLTQLLPFLYILNRIIPVQKALNAVRAEIMIRRPYLRILRDLLRTDNKPQIPDGHKKFIGLKSEICFQNITFCYKKNDHFSLVNMDFEIPVGKTTALVGESGAGKSTIVNLLLRFYDPQDGKILIDGKPLSELKLASYRQRIGVVSQDIFLFNDTVKRNIVFGLDAVPSDEDIIAAAQKAGAHDFIMKLADGYDTILGSRGMRLSGGQRQRISITQAILRDPEILILDEATSALDVQTEQLIHQAIIDLSHNRTVIIVAHRLSTIQGADQIIVLKDGQVIEIGRPAQLYDQKGKYYELVNV